MVLPPPNVTGELHLGHGLTSAVQDAIVRWQRMRGRSVVWVPGSDHAGIATQAAVERHLDAKAGKRVRKTMGREAFLEEVEAWRRQKGDSIFQQLKRMAASLDWTRASFTMSPQHCAAVDAAFVTLFDRGLIYRGDMLVNWCCALGSAISDIEVDHVEVEGKTKLKVPGYDQAVEFGVMYDIAYEFADRRGRIVVSTTRPETLLGDTGVAVHPDDPRYSSSIGRRLVHPFRRGEVIPVVADAQSADPNIGTGAVKLTPAHSQV